MKIPLLLVTSTALVASYGPPSGGSGGNLGGTGSNGCVGGSCNGAASPTGFVPPSHSASQGFGGGSSFSKPGHSGHSSQSQSSKPYWWSGSQNPFAQPAGHMVVTSGSNGGHRETSPHIVQRPIERPRPAFQPQPSIPVGQPQPSIPVGQPQPSAHQEQNVIAPTFVSCGPEEDCVYWQSCQNGFILPDVGGLIDKRTKPIPQQVASQHQICDVNKVCCRRTPPPQSPGFIEPLPSPGIDLPSVGIVPHSPPQHQPAPGPAPVPSSISQAYIPPLPSTSLQQPSHAAPSLHQPQRPVIAPAPQQPTLTQGPSHGVPVQPQPHRPAPSIPQPHRPAPSIPQPHIPAPSIPQPHRPAPSIPQPHRPAPSISRPQRPSPGIFKPQAPSGVPQPQRPPRPPVHQPPIQQPMGTAGMGMMMMMGPMLGGTCSAGMFCVDPQTCNPYNGFIINDISQVPAVWPDSPTVPLLPCFVPGGGIQNGVCCQQTHPLPGGAD